MAEKTNRLYEAAIKAYEPTLRDRLANLLLGSALPGSARANIVEGLTGSRGLGNTGVGLVDLTPVGIPMAAQEAKLAADRGNAIEAVANAMAVIPAAKIPVQAAKGAATQGIRAYHGSPHSFERFDLSKIGTGEGAQAYGHGLYFAENPRVAEEYKKNLSDSMTSRPRWFIQGTEAAPGSPEAKAASIINELGYAKAKKFADSTAMQFGADPRMGREAEFWRGVQNVLQQPLSKRDISQKFGHMYEVNIRANPDQFLDWDKPRDAQPQLVKDYFGRAYPKAWENAADGASLYQLAQRQMPNSQLYKELAQENIPGIKYLDGGSRGVGEG